MKVISLVRACGCLTLHRKDLFCVSLEEYDSWVKANLG